MIRVASLGILGFSLCCGVAGAQEPLQVPMPAPEPQHKWLHQFVGEWSTTSKATMGPDQPAMEGAGTITSRMLGDLWVLNEMKSEWMGDSVVGIQTIGYDASKGKYIGTWVDNMTSHMWRYEGTVDETGKKLTLEAEGPNFVAAGKMTKFRDAYEFVSSDHVIMSSSMLGEDGKWVTFMTGDAKRITAGAVK